MECQFGLNAINCTLISYLNSVFLFTKIYKYPLTNYNIDFFKRNFKISKARLEFI